MTESANELEHLRTKFEESPSENVALTECQKALTETNKALAESQRENAALTETLAELENANEKLKKEKNEHDANPARGVNDNENDESTKRRGHNPQGKIGRSGVLGPKLGSY